MLADAEARLAELLQTAGAPTLADAERLHTQREDAARTVAEQRRIRDDLLQGTTAKGLAERILALREGLATEPPVDDPDDRHRSRGRRSAIWRLPTRRSVGPSRHGSRRRVS